LLRFPAEPADTGLAARNVGDHRGAAGNAVRLAGARVGENRAVGNRFDQPGAEQRSGQALGDDIRLGRNDFLRRGIDREVLQQRAAQRGERIELPVHHPPEARLEDRARSTGRLRGVACHAGDIIEDGPQSAFGRIHVLEFVEACREIRQLCRREPRQWVAKGGTGPRVGTGVGQRLRTSVRGPVLQKIGVRDTVAEGCQRGSRDDDTDAGPRDHDTLLQSYSL